MYELLQALDVAVMEKLLLEVGSRVPPWWDTAAVPAPTLRAVDTCIWPSTLDANCVHVEFGLGAEPNPLLRKVTQPIIAVGKACPD